MRFADTGWWVAWATPRDARHQDARGMIATLGRSEQVLTTNLVIGETWTFVRRKGSHRSALAFLDRVARMSEQRRLVVHRVTEAQELAAWEWLRQHDERVFSFVDATSFRVMRDRRITEALAFDQDFAAAGFVESRLPPVR